MGKTLDIKEHVPLAPLSTLGVGGSARYFCEVSNTNELECAVNFARDRGIPIKILGGGSNILVDDGGYDGLVLSILFSGMSFIPLSDGAVRAVAGAGNVWDRVVEQSISRGLWGIENLSGIPGKVGAAPIQNIGAYGSELSDVIESVDIFDHGDLVHKKLSKEECLFGYRDSAFKKSRGSNHIVLGISMILNTRGAPNLSYKDLSLRLGKMNYRSVSISQVRDVVLSIRGGKFPNLEKVGTAGSFFKNPIVEKKLYNKLCSLYPGLPGFDVDSGHMKLSLAWVLDHICVLKGVKVGGVGLYEKQPLVLVTDKKSTSKDIELFAKRIEREVFNKTNIKIEREVQNFI